MRVELPQSVPNPATPSTAATGVAAPAKRRRPSHERLIFTLTSKRVAIPVLGLCIALMGWALLVRAPQGRNAMVVTARSAPPARNTNSAITAEKLALLRQQQAERRQSLVRDRKEILPILSHLELRAEELGWNLERALKPAVPSPHGLTNLTLHPVALHLSPAGGPASVPFHRLTQWLREVSSLTQRFEITQLDLAANDRGLSGASLVLQFYSDNHHAEAPSK